MRNLELALWADQAAPIITELCGMAGRAEGAIERGPETYGWLAAEFDRVAKTGQAWLRSHDVLIGSLPLLIAHCEILAASFQLAAVGVGDRDELAKMVSDWGQDVFLVPRMIEDLTS